MRSGPLSAHCSRRGFDGFQFAAAVTVQTKRFREDLSNGEDAGRQQSVLDVLGMEWLCSDQRSRSPVPSTSEDPERTADSVATANQSLDVNANDVVTLSNVTMSDTTTSMRYTSAFATNAGHQSHCHQSQRVSIFGAAEECGRSDRECEFRCPRTPAVSTERDRRIRILGALQLLVSQI